MGMCTYFKEENIEIIDKEGLIRFVERWVILFPDNNECAIEFKKHNYSFKAFDEWKIQGYWYWDLTIFFNELSKYIEGNIKWAYEDGAQIVFNYYEKKLEISIGIIIWDEYITCDLISNLPKNDKIQKRLNKLKILNKLGE